jgi:hypothetical protein
MAISRLECRDDMNWNWTGTLITPSVLSHTAPQLQRLRNSSLVSTLDTDWIGVSWNFEFKFKRRGRNMKSHVSNSDLQEG